MRLVDHERVDEPVSKLAEREPLGLAGHARFFVGTDGELDQRVFLPPRADRR